MTDPAARIMSVMDPAEQELAEVYAKALLELPGGDERAEEICGELAWIAGMLRELDGAAEVFASPLLNDTRRAELIEKVFHGRVRERTEALLGVMARNGRIGLLGGVAERLRVLLDERRGKVEVVVTTARPLDAPAEQELIRTLRDALGAEPLLRAEVDENVLGGMVVRVGDRVYDASVAAEIKGLKDALTAKRSTIDDSQARSDTDVEKD